MRRNSSPFKWRHYASDERQRHLVVYARHPRRVRHLLLCHLEPDRASNPDATILGAFGFNQGSGNPGLTTSVDALSIGTGGPDGSCVTYNLDPYRVVTTKDECKNGGYNRVRDAQGNPFKNQGQCVSYVESNRGGNH